MHAAASFLRRLAALMHGAAGLCLTAMMLVTVADVLLRAFKRPIVGTYELIGFLGAWAIAFSLPKTSLDKGQVLMDFAVGRLPSLLGLAAHLLTRALGAGLFALLSWNLFAMGRDLRVTGDETALLHLPHYPLAFGISFACAVECLVLLLQMADDRKEGA